MSPIDGRPELNPMGEEGESGEEISSSLGLGFPVCKQKAERDAIYILKALNAGCKDWAVTSPAFSGFWIFLPRGLYLALGKN